MAETTSLRDRDYIIVAALIVLALFLFIGTGGTAPAEWEGTFETVSADASLNSFTPVAAPFRYTGPFSYQWFQDGGTGPWTIQGLWTYLQGPGLVLHPSTPTPDTPANTTPAVVSQTVELPDRNRIRAVLKARNGAKVFPKADIEGCLDSRVTLRVEPSGDTDTSAAATTTAIVNGTAQTLMLDISRYAGETVRLSAVAAKGDGGCGMWRGEYTNLQELYIEA